MATNEAHQESTDKQNERPSAPRPPSIVYGPSAPIPITMTFGELLDHHVEVRPNKPAVISHVQGYTVSFKELRSRSLQLARAFSKDGIGKGDLVAVSMGSRVEYFEV
jgi:mevalonyl-CoA ligase